MRTSIEKLMADIAKDIDKLRDKESGANRIMAEVTALNALCNAAKVLSSIENMPDLSQIENRAGKSALVI